jgi:glycosyltransferase involved in cell wall biosynthesis
MSKQKAFVILSPGFAASETDTACLPMQQSFVKNLATLYPAIEIFVLSFQYPFYRSIYKSFGATIMSFGGRNRGGVSKYFLRSEVSKALQKLNAEKQIIGILSFWFGECAYVGRSFAVKNGLKHYCWLLGQDARANNKYAKKFFPGTNNLIALSDFLQEEFERNHGVRPFAVISPGIESGINRTSRNIDLLAVGSLIPLKQFEVFISSVAAIKQKVPEVKALLVGEGPERKRLMNLVDSLGLRDNIILTGKMDHKEVMCLMQRAKILLHPSSYEGYSGVCQEALSCGAHVISFCRAANSDIRQWHIVRSEDEIVKKALALLQDASTIYQPIPFPPMAATAKQMMDLYLSEVE